MNELEQIIGYQFKDPKTLKIALTHSSFANEAKGTLKNNERLEFLGDAVLSICVSDYLFFHNLGLPEGELTRLRASVVCEKALNSIAVKLGLGRFLKLGKGEENTGGRTRPSILADAVEAIIAAIYIDGGMNEARKFVLDNIKPLLLESESRSFVDYKTKLQEIIQQNPEEIVEYVTVKEEGPDHDKEFEVEVRINSNRVAKGVGKSKKEAEQMAAKSLLQLMGEDETR